jgi:hypothetical protein
MQKIKMNQIFERLIVFLLLICCSPHGYAACEEHLSVESEFKQSEYVVVATVKSFRYVRDPEDIEGYAATIYSVAINRVFRGKPRANIEIYSVNTTSRFPMEIGKKYLLFISKTRDGKEVNSCGNSELLAMRKSELSKVISLAGKK